MTLRTASTAAFKEFTSGKPAWRKSGSLTPLDDLMQAAAGLPMPEGLDIFQSLPDVQCSVCKKRIRSEKTKSGRWQYPDFNADTGICGTCEKYAEALKNINDHMQQAGVPQKYLKASFETFTPDDSNRAALNFCRKYTLKADQSRGLYIHGECGVGKTHLGIAVLRAMVLRAHSAFFISTPDLLFKLRKTFSPGSAVTDEDELRRYLSYSYLLLDDFGVEKSSEWVRQTLDYVIYHRDAQEKPVIITSNLSPDKIRSQLGNRIMSRIGGMCHELKLGGTDKRKRKI